MKKILLFILVLFITESNSQIAGSFNVPGSFPTIAAAINTLNILGVAGPCTINVTAGYTETAPVGGYRLINPPGISATNQVLFQKNGSGPNPLITAYTGTCYPSNAIQDGVWFFIGTDYVTVDGLDIFDPNTTSPATMEFGYGFYKLNAGNGCQNNTIKNCTITLNKNNSVAVTGTVNFACGSRGIDISSSTYTTYQAVLTPTTAAGTNSYNKFYSNVIQNCHNGIALMGSTTLPDSQNDIGGLSSATGNTILNFGGGNTSQTFGIRTGAQASVNISNNYLYNNNGSGADPLTELNAIYTASVANTFVNINNNTITLFSGATGTVPIKGITYQGHSTTTLTVNNNIFPSYTYSNSVGAQFNLIVSGGAKIANITGNSINNVKITPYSAAFISAVNSTTAFINSNTIKNVYSYITTGQETFINASSVSGVISNNLVDSVSYLSGLTIILADQGDQAVTNNTITNVNAGDILGIRTYAITGTTYHNVSGNVFRQLSTKNNFTGILDMCNNTSATTISTITANTIYSVSANPSSTTLTTVGNICAISCSLISNSTISANKIYGLMSTSAGTIEGINLTRTTPTVANNVIGDFKITNSNQPISVSAIATYSTSGVNMQYNSIYLNNTINTGTNSGSSVLKFYSTGSFTLNNNILINTSLPTGTGLTSIITRTNSSITNYSTASNRNLFYVGTPAANRTFYYDIANNYGTLFALKTGVSPREAQSVTENPPFITTNGALPNTLDIDPSIPTQVEKGGAPIAGITTDYAGTIRNATTPDIGAWEGNFTQADILPPVTLSGGFTSGACNTTNRTYTVTIKDTSGVATGTISPRLYYKVNFGLYTSAQGTLTSGTPTLGVWAFNLNYTASLSDVIYYFLAVEDASPLNNLSLIPGAGSSASDVNNIFVPPTAPNNYTIETYPTVSVNSGTLCSGLNFTMTPSGAFTYTYSGGSAVVSPTTTTSYSVTGSTPSGCVSTNTAVATVTVFTSPVITVNTGSICIGQSFTFTPSGAVTYTYSGGSSIVSPSSNTTYTITGYDGLGCASNQAISTITVGTVTITASASSPTVCGGNSVVLFGGGSASGYTWSGSVIDNTPFVPSSTNIYTVSGAAANGCIGSATIQVAVAPSPTITVVPATQTICAGQTATFTASGATFSYTLNPGNVIGPQFLVSPASSTSYTAIGSNSNGCTGSATIQLTVLPSPTISALTSSNTVCPGTNVILSGTGSSGSFTYTPGNLTGPQATVSPMSTTTYTVKGENAIGCTSTSTVQVNVLPSPTVSVFESNNYFCSGETVTLSASGANNYTYTPGNIVGATATVTPYSTTTYTVVGTDGNGCSGISTLTLYVYPSPTVSVANNTICVGETATLTPSGSTYYYLIPGMVWGPTFFVSPTATAVYTIVGQNTSGCSDTASVTVTVKLCIGIEELSKKYGLSVYPNPSNGILNFKKTTANKLEIKIVDVVSKLIYRTEISDELTTLNLNVPPGIYFVQISDDRKLIGQEKIIIHK